MQAGHKQVAETATADTHGQRALADALRKWLVSCVLLHQVSRHK